MRIGVQQHREVTLTMAYPAALGIAGGATAAVLGIAVAWHRKHLPRASKFERWQLPESPRV
ncbi:MAG TPA: hypothetical protein VGG40_13330 [Solirubrobacterales bacterium]|jgi:hypothetical protein